MLNNEIRELISYYSAGARETFLEMDNNFSTATGYNLLDFNNIEEVLENGSASYKIDDNTWLNVEFEVEHLGVASLLDTIILIKKVETV